MQFLYQRVDAPREIYVFPEQIKDGLACAVQLSLMLKLGHFKKISVVLCLCVLYIINRI